MIVVGALAHGEDLRAILELAHELDCPIMADVTSGLRFFQDPHIVHYADQLLLDPEFSSQIPDTVIQFGVRITSKRVQTFLSQRRGKPHIFVNDRVLRHDPLATVTQIVTHTSPLTPLHQVERGIRRWTDASSLIHDRFDAIFHDDCELSEPYVARAISKGDFSNRALFLSSSMPIRDMDRFAAPGFVIPNVAANRGVSGIDGVISTACGYAHGLQKPTTLLIGDLAFLHDGNGLSFLSKMKVPVCIVVNNNHGGGIFSFLPVAKRDDVFREFFDTPHDFCLEGLSKTYGVRHIHVATRREFDEAYAEATTCNEHRVIEVKSSTKANWEFHQALTRRFAPTSPIKGEVKRT